MSTKPVIDTSDMDLPEGRQCADCMHIKRCMWMFDCKPESTKCDFAPSRFRDAVTVVDVDPEVDPKFKSPTRTSAKAGVQSEYAHLRSRAELLAYASEKNYNPLWVDRVLDGRKKGKGVVK